LLDQDISRVGLQESQKYNLLSCRLVTEIVKTSLGPRGMEKMYIDILGEDSITKHGGAFLRKVDVVQPAAKTVIEAVNTVDTHVGDGTTSTAVLIGSLIRNAEELLKFGIPVAAITRGYEKSLDFALEALDEIKIKSDRSEKEIMKQLVTTCLEGKAIFEAYVTFVSLGRDRIPCPIKPFLMKPYKARTKAELRRWKEVEAARKNRRRN